jgi:hypothetical protein
LEVIENERNPYSVEIRELGPASNPQIDAGSMGLQSALE